LLAQITVAEKYGPGDLATGHPDEIMVEVVVTGPSWVKPAKVTLYANGSMIRESEAGTGAGIEKARVRWVMPRPAHDVHLAAIATAPPVTAPFWAMTKPYQPLSPRWEGRCIGSTNPVWLDADGDGKFTPAREYARRLIALQSTEPARLLPALERYDESVAIQAASLCAATGVDLSGEPFTSALKPAAPQVAAGFAKFIKAAAMPGSAK
jgi:hypothetical protein